MPNSYSIRNNDKGLVVTDVVGRARINRGAVSSLGEPHSNHQVRRVHVQSGARWEPGSKKWHQLTKTLVKDDQSDRRDLSDAI